MFLSVASTVGRVWTGLPPALVHLHICMGRSSVAQCSALDLPSRLLQLTATATEAEHSDGDGALQQRVVPLAGSLRDCPRPRPVPPSTHFAVLDGVSSAIRIMASQLRSGPGGEQRQGRISPEYWELQARSVRHAGAASCALLSISWMYLQIFCQFRTSPDTCASSALHEY